MALATLSIDLEARLAKLDEGFTKAQREAEKSSAAIAKSFERLNGVASGLGVAFAGVFSAGAIGQWLTQTADGLDALNDAADATGASFDKLSGLEGLAARTGTSFDTVTSILIKFNQQLSAAGDANSDAAKALRAIGLEAEQLRNIDPADALKLTADALAQFADDGTKARLVQELFGKSVKEAAPFLKDLAEAGALNARNTREQAEEAERFKKAVAGLSADLADIGRAIAVEVFPWISRMVAEARDGIEVFGGLGAAMRGLAFESADYGKGFRDALAEIDQLQAEIDADRQRVDNASLLDRLFGLGNIEKYVSAKEEELAQAQKRLQYFMRRQAATDPGVRASDEQAAAVAGGNLDGYLNGLLNRQIDGFDALFKGQPSGQPKAPKASLPKLIQPEELDGLLAGSLTKQLESLDKELEKSDQLEQRRLQQVLGAGSDLQDATSRINVGLIASDRARGEAQIELERTYAQRRLAELDATADERKALEDDLAAYIAARQAQLTEELKPEWQKTIEGWADTTEMMAKSFDQLMGGIVQHGENALTDFIRTGKLSIGGLVDFVADAVARMLAQQAVAKIVELGSFLFGSFSPAAQGKVLGAGGEITAFASGGIVSSPTYFGYGNGRRGLMGEAGPEAIMPLGRDSSGRLGVRGSGGGTNITLNIQSGVSRADLAAMLPTLQAQIEASLIGRARRPGSPL